MGGSVAPFAWSTVWTNGGLPAVSHKLFVYEAGLSVKATTWQDAAMTVPHSNPIIINSAGQIPVGFFLNGGLSYKFVLAPPLDSDPPLSPVWTRDHIAGGGGSLQPWLRNAATGITYLANLTDKVGIATAAPTKPFSVAERFTIDANGRVLVNGAPAYDLFANVRSTDVWLDAADQAGIDTTGYGGEFNLPSSGKIRDIFYVTGTLGTTDLSPSDSEFSAFRFELKNKGPNLSSCVRGIIGNVTITAGGHARAGYFRTTADVGATGYMTSILAAVHAGAAQAAGSAMGLFLHSTGTAAKAYAVQLTNDVGSGWAAGIVFDDVFSTNTAAIRLRQSTVNGRIGWGGTLSPYIESTTADELVIGAAGPANIKVGIGTIAPQRQLHVVGSGGAVASFPTINASDWVVFENAAQSHVAIVGGTTSNMSVRFYRSADAAARAMMQYSGQFEHLTFSVAAVDRVRITSTGSLLTQVNGALTTTAVDGFLYVPTCAGVPTGTPTVQTGMAALVVDSTNNNLYIYSGGAWRDCTV